MMSRNAPRTGPLALMMAVLTISAPDALQGQDGRTAPRTPSGWIGVQVEGLEVRRSNGTVETDLVVTSVVDGTPADLAGFRAGDRIVLLNGRAATFDYFRTVATSLHSGDRVRVTVSRDRRTMEVDLEAVARPAPELVALPPGIAARIDSVWQRLDSFRGGAIPEAARLDPPVAGTDPRTGTGHRLIAVGPDSTRTFVVPAWNGDPQFLSRQSSRSTLTMGSESDQTAPSLMLYLRGTDDGDRVREDLARMASPHIVGQNRVAGAAFIVLNPELATYFEVEGGLLVTDVTPGTPAAEGGIRSGDVIVEVGGSVVTSLDELRRALSRPATSGRPVSLVRRGRSVQITIPR